MSVDVTQFDSVEDLDVYFKKQKAKAPDEDAERAVDATRLEARSQFFEAKAQRAQLEVAKRDAFEKWPRAKEFPEYITGRTPEEVAKSIQTLHERLEVQYQNSEKAKQDAEEKEHQEREQLRAQYGQPAGAGASTQQSGSKDIRDEAWERVTNRLQKGDGGQDSAFKRDFAIGVGKRLGEAVNQSITDSSYRASFRKGEPGDLRVADDRRAKRGGRQP